MKTYLYLFLLNLSSEPILASKTLCITLAYSSNDF